MNFLEEPKLSLDKIRTELVRLEDSIIFALIERAQFAHNSKIYQPSAESGLGFKDFKGSFLQFFITEVEQAHAKVRRYTSPDELPFSDPAKLPAPVLPPLSFPKLLIPNSINFNSTLLGMYIESIVPLIASPGDDQNYGSSATKDCEALQLLSRRIHFGKFVAEAKFNDPKYRQKYIELIKRGDRDGIEELLTNRVVEEKLLRRLRRKAAVYGREIEDGDETPPYPPPSPKTGDTSIIPLVDKKISGLRLPVDVVVNMYKEFVIPLTKLIEVEYLMVRLEYPDFIPGS